MTEDLSSVLRQLTGELAAARSDIATLLQHQRNSVANDQLIHTELRAIDRRLIAVEISVQSIIEDRKADAPDRAKIATWLAVGSFLLFMAGALIPPLLLDWWRTR
jgi:hypothetical protein